ncbi:PREDICTED: uncharacterized protein LOC105569275 isoform X2 [Vollenhovia emeryi]|uniref:uncharacterized protein LOC105569275 isoform X2 n=1 Tax=Vollenhovia emeryi TaxID=411798 RepID=UPI0005F44478|nr:PREDICTED: uncharacterized protein LOC105569275 isoform X2 [Vollenhovia emeryi]
MSLSTIDNKEWRGNSPQTSNSPAVSLLLFFQIIYSLKITYYTIYAAIIRLRVAYFQLETIEKSLSAISLADYAFQRKQYRVEYVSVGIFIMTSSGKTRFILPISVLYLLLTDVSHCWNLTSLNISDDVLIWRFAVWRNRAFLAIPRSENEKEKGWKPTVVQVPWPEINLSLNVANAAISPKPFPKEASSKRDYESLVSVTGLDVDARGRLWILDAPDQRDRWPRIVIYDLKRNDRLVSSAELAKVTWKQLSSLVIDPLEDQWGFRGYIADAGDETIVVYSCGLRKWWKLKMLHGPKVPRVQSVDLAVSRRNSILYVTGRDTHDLFSIDLDQVLRMAPSRGAENVTVTWLGKKLGSSVGLFCDLKDGLHYFMTSERASVRWDTKLPFNAQSHSVLVQNDDVPCITDYIMDSRRNVWGLVNWQCPAQCIGQTLLTKIRVVSLVNCLEKY